MADVSHAAAPTRRTAERSVHATWLYTLGSIVFIYLVFDTILLVHGLVTFTQSGTTTHALIVALLLASTVVHVRYCWFLRVGLGGGLPHPAWTIGMLAASVLTWVLGFFTDELWPVTPLPLWMALVLIASLISTRARWWMIAAGAALTIGYYLFSLRTLPSSAFDADSANNPILITYAALLPLMVLLSLWWWDLVVELDRHRRSAAELAIAKERLRFAADLHDIQGHHLQVIALKSELAERMLQRDPAAAREQLRETRLIAAEALQETRSLVSGYREVGLDDELRNAREVLSAAGARCELRLDALPTSADARRALAFIVREATTNILRHSTASRVHISLRHESGCSTVTIVNDGVDAPHAPNATGTGISGLRARVSELGGTLTTAITDERFELSASIPDAVGSTVDDEENAHV